MGKDKIMEHNKRVEQIKTYLEMAARRAVEQCGKDMPWQVCTVHIDGTVTKN